MMVNQNEVANELKQAMQRCQKLKIQLSLYLARVSGSAFLLSYSTKGIIMIACRRNLHEIRNSFVALILIIQAGIIAALQTEQMSIIQDRWPPESYSNTDLTSSPVETNYFCFLNLKNSVMSKLKPEPTTTLLLALLVAYFFFISFSKFSISIFRRYYYSSYDSSPPSSISISNLFFDGWCYSGYQFYSRIFLLSSTYFYVILLVLATVLRFNIQLNQNQMPNLSNIPSSFPKIGVYDGVLGQVLGGLANKTYQYQQQSRELKRELIFRIRQQQNLVIMDIFKSPWKSSHNIDPILSLSNSQRVDHKQLYCDRYCMGSLRKNLFDIDVEDGPECKGADLRATLNQEKNKKYRGILVKTCSTDSEKKDKSTKTNPCSKYMPKISRPGYLLGQQLEEQEIIAAKPRNIPKQPYRILNAPHLKDDFYTNLLDWSQQDLVSVVLDNAAYIWNSKENQTQKLVQGFISSIKWGKGLMVGEQTGKLRMIDIEKKRETGKHRNHSGRIGTMDCNNNLVASGSKDCTVLVWDIRSREIASKWQSHKQQVCGVKWSFDGNMVASGGNDNLVCIYDMRTSKVMHKFNQHTAAVKALAWSPHQNYILSTGGGSTDKSIRVWNINENRCLKKIDTGSQVCNMMYSINSNELVSTHGYSMNAINIWESKNMDKVGTLRGHSYRVLYMARSPDGESILTGSGDQTLRFWKVFPSCTGLYNRVSMLEAKNVNLR